MGEQRRGMAQGFAREIRRQRVAYGCGSRAPFAKRLGNDVRARVARRAVFERDPGPEIGFVLEEWSLRRPLGGRAALRGQLEHLLEVAGLRNVELQVMPMDREEHAGLAGGIEVLKFEDGSAVGRSPVVAHGRPVHPGSGAHAP